MHKQTNSHTSKPTHQAKAARCSDKLRRALAELNRLTGSPLKVECRGTTIFVDLRC